METKRFTLPRKIVSYKTTESWTTVPHVTFIYEADATEMLNEFSRLNANSPSLKLSLNTLLLKICTEAIKAASQVNARIKYNPKRVTGEIEVIKNIHISMPWMLENGEIITINLRGFENKTLMEMQEYINNIARKMKNCNISVPLYQVSVNTIIEELKKGHLLKVANALLGTPLDKSKPCKQDIVDYDKIPAEDKITAHDLEPGTVTISNLGSICKGINGFMGILEIIPPQVFTIGIGSIQEKACVIKNKNGENSIEIRKIIPMCLAFDHRALNFGEVVPFIQKLNYILEHSRTIFTE